MFPFRKYLVLSVLFTAQLLHGLSVGAQSQATSPYIPSVLPPSPNAAALMKFTDVPVSPYTGTADVTVPIYTIQAKGISVPVSVAYHTGGIRLKEEASSVGLGWALNAGGSISRTIMDHDDFGTQGLQYFTTAVPQLAGDMSISQPDQPSDAVFIGPAFYDFFCTYLVNTSGGQENFYNAFTTGTAQYDMEPDIYSYNFPGHSGKFIITRAGNVVLQKQENIVVQFQSGGQWFTITDDEGNKFYFTVTETTQTVGGATPVSSWLLSKIVTQQQDSVVFTYTAGGGGTVQSDINEEYITPCANSGYYTVQNSPTIYNDQTLQTIDFTDGRLQFLYDSHRSDLSGAMKLDSIILFSKSPTGTLTYMHEHDFYYSYFNGSYNSGADTLEFYRLKLDSVKQVSLSGSLPPYSFQYNSVSPGALSAKHSFNVDHWGYFNGVNNSALTFIPAMSFVTPPEGGSTGQEYASYNGGNRSPNLEYAQTFSLLQVTYPTGGKSVFSYQANDYDYTNSANNGPPFQGVSLYTVDSAINAIAHDSTSGTIDLTTLYPVQPSNTGPSNLTINLAFIYQNNNDSNYKNSTGKLDFIFTGPGINVYQDINSATHQPGSPAWTVSIPLVINAATSPPGKYHWAAYIDPSVDTVTIFSEIRITVEYQETQLSYNLLQNNSFISPASGLRIQSIADYKDASTASGERVYNYTYMQDKLGTGNPQQYTYGRLMSFPSYLSYAITSVSGGSYCTNVCLFSSSNSSLSSVISGNIVGYDQVTETRVDPLTGLDIGKTVYSYFNRADTPVAFNGGFCFPGIMNMGNTLNGTLLSKIDYVDYGGAYAKVAETDNFYHTTNRIVYYSPKYQYIYDLVNGPGSIAGSYCAADTAVEVQTLADFYPSIKSERMLMDSTRSIVYQQGDTTKSVITRQADFYDNPIHYQVTRSSTIDSKGDTLVTRLKYPQDYIPTGQNVTHNTILDSLIGRNMVNLTIEKQDSLYYPGNPAGDITGSQLNLYRQVTGTYPAMVPDRTYKLDIQAPITNFQPFAISNNTTTLDTRLRQMISFDSYDSYNDLQQYTTTDQNPVTIVWDYKHVYPIAQVKNAVLADVAYTSFEADGVGGWSSVPTAGYVSGSGVTGTQCYSITGNTIIKTGMSSTQTYICSYWSTGGSLSVTSTTAINQGKTINIGGTNWTYYEHTVTGTGGMNVTGSGNIDELRLYPKASQMTTYTYTPLIGMTTTCDVDNKVTYYFYDAYQRLIRIKDQDGNIIKTFQYHYANQNPANQ